MLSQTKKRLITTAICAAVCTALGILLHFLFEISGNNYFAALFAPVNESTWEHLKLLYTPFALSALIEYFIYGNGVSNYFSSKLWGVLVGMLTIIVLYYTYTGITGKNIAAVNIGIYIFGVIIAYTVAYLAAGRFSHSGKLLESASIFGFAAIGAALMIFTFMPPHIPLFLDPSEMIYGIR